MTYTGPTWLPPLLAVEGVLATIMWAALVIWCMPATVRVIRGKPRDHFDPAVLVFGSLALNAFWFALRPIVFGRLISMRTFLDIAWLAIAYAFAMLCGFGVVRVILFYRKRP